jgi:TonB family protein
MSRTAFILGLVCLCGLAPAAGLSQTAPASTDAAQTQAAPEQQQQPAAPPSPERERGAELLTQGSFDAAAEALRRAVKRDPSDAEAWRMLGVSLGQSGDVKEARKAFEKVLKLRPASPDARAEFAYTLLLVGKERDARREAERALKLDPAHATARYVLTALKLRSGKAEAALKDAEALLRLKPEFPAAAALAGEALLNVYVEELDRVSKRYPVSPDTSEEVRRPVLEKRDAALAPVFSRMQEAAGRLEAFAAARPDKRTAEAWRELAETLRVYSRRGTRPLDAGPFRQAEVTRKAVIISKPEPGFTEEARKENVTGVVRLRAVLAADGRVRHILVIKGLPHGLTEKAVAAARHIRFTPAERDGRPVPQFIILEYNFNIYDRN